MNCCKHLLVWAFCATSAFAQSTPSAAPPPAPASPVLPGTPGQLKVRGPEATAQQDPKRIIATIGGNPITAAEGAEMLKAVRPEDIKRFSTSNQMPKLLQQIYMQQQFAGEAEKLHLGEQAPYKDQIRITRENILAQAYIVRITNPGGSQPDLQKYYNDHAGDFEQVKVSGIYVAFTPTGAPVTPGTKGSRTEAEAGTKANELAQKLKGGADFAALAKTDSDNQASASHGGELGTFNGSDTSLPADIRGAIAKLQPGQVSDPIRLGTGYYILKVDSRTKRTFQQVQGEILEKIQREQGQAILQKQLEKYNIQVQDPDFFSVTTAPAPGPKIPSLANPGGNVPPPPAATPPAKP